MRGVSPRPGSLGEVPAVLEVAPAWWSNRLKRLVRTGKRYLVDGGLAAAVLGVRVGEVMADGDLMGRSLDTFVAAQLRAELLTPDAGHLHHLRQHGVRRTCSTRRSMSTWSHPTASSSPRRIHKPA
ncbi:MAG: DUF4143 domain-containing protein [Actinobacteria bacterium]|nr:DUF4143 domain-containing protein [Actinomycetota bacterium]